MWALVYNTDSEEWVASELYTQPFGALGGVYAWWRWPARNTIDGDLNTICASHWERNAWLSIHLPASSTVEYVVVYVRCPVPILAHLRVVPCPVPFCRHPEAP